MCGNAKRNLNYFSSGTPKRTSESTVNRKPYALYQQAPFQECDEFLQTLLQHGILLVPWTVHNCDLKELYTLNKRSEPKCTICPKHRTRYRNSEILITSVDSIVQQFVFHPHDDPRSTFHNMRDHGICQSIYWQMLFLLYLVAYHSRPVFQFNYAMNSLYPRCSDKFNN
jgi:hypothetical protein